MCGRMLEVVFVYSIRLGVDNYCTPELDVRLLWGLK